MQGDSYTPGPWAVSPHPWPEQIGCCPLTGRPYSVHAADNRNVAAATTKEIALLIAAAPEMYEALENGLALIAGDATGAEWKRGCRQFTKAARAALAKARGDQ
jgi:hypothetical protein